VTTRTIVLPYGPRRVFIPFHLRKERWAILVAHRRCGKTVACINDLIAKALSLQLDYGKFGYVGPFLAQAKETAWEYLKRFAEPAIADKNEGELWVELVNGARIRIHGADNPDRLRGPYFDGIVMDEYADMRPSVWGEVIRPMLADRHGWATFIGTPKGRNEFFKVWSRALIAEDWYSSMLKASATGVLSADELESARGDMTEEQYAQEFECDFTAALMGAYYGKEIALAETEKRISAVPLDRAADVYASWDLGHRDATAVWIGQLVGREIHFIDYLEHSGVDLGWYVDELKAKPYKIVEHWLPHDADAHELISGKTRKEYLEGREFKCRVIPRHEPEDRINAARIAFNRCWFDAVKCEPGLEALRMYQERRDEKRNVGLGPLHDWASDPADSFGYFIMAMNDRPQAKWDKPRQVKGLV
jgi:phage terminase large subunit